VSEAAVRPAEFAGAAVPANDAQVPLPLVAAATNATDYEECLACQ
jgi:hypothetical protein